MVADAHLGSYVHVDQDSRATIATDDLERILVYILRIAFSHSNVHRMDSLFQPSPRGTLYSTCRRTVPHAHSGNEDNWAKLDCCAELTLSNWPDTCSATWFDERFEFIYRYGSNTSRRAPEKRPSL